ncbi:hypothetical protein SERLADRAFT_408541 [Serpula lacrymans var. lacrymans S7.9]|uniref:Cytochrome P450 n=1 Tax=Serpula lacrymans var. lacrymans (strain S7.9) TaxID=578457 RepID=F8NXH0_SERL9|nr:uncharacterized protein SERLADRAFT_408541 [Serpula lacrymans var. lacrymans S7.9]EGO24642.1 hypothetical protein SERLADRAFT_408541 [Serpula lacrymans var. lacrymans S7.9]
MGLTLLEWALAALGAFLIRHLLRSKHSPPPGPKPLPFIGNIFDVPTDKPWLTFVNWKAKYGDLMSFTIFRRRMVIINSAELAADILDKKSAIYSDRPRLVMASDLVGFSDSTPLLQYGETLREHRSLIGSRTLMHEFHPVQENIIHNFLQDVLNNPDCGDLNTHIRKGLILSPEECQDGNDPLITLANHALVQFSELVGFGAFLVDMLPFLRYVPEWFPGAGFQKTAKAYRETLNEATERPFKYVKDQMASKLPGILINAAGIAPVSFISSCLDRADLTAEDESIIKWTGFSLYVVQKKAQAEIDAVVGNNRLPTLADRVSLPYVEALSQEVVRWHAVVTSTIHVAMEDDTHNGCFIPKGSYVSPNIWAILHDERTYSEPELFKPERFLGDRPEHDPRTVSFGFGRRICPDMSLQQLPLVRLVLSIHLADASIFISSAMTLAVFSIEKYIENGVEITPKVEPPTCIMAHLTPFKCSIKPRSLEAEALIHETPSM